MKISLPRKSLRTILRWSRIAMIVVAAGALGYCAFALVDSWYLERQASREFDSLRQHPASGQSAPAGPGLIASGGLVGRMEIPRLGLSVAIAEGTGARTLRRAAGHIAGTQFPGGPGNVGIAGHRDTLFRPLRDIRRDDVILLTSLQGTYRYRVVSTKITGPSDVAVLNPDGHEILTLVTCYPFYFVGPSPDRFIVRAERIA